MRVLGIETSRAKRAASLDGYGIPSRSGSASGAQPGAVAPNQAYRNSAYWGGLRLRSNLVSTLPRSAVATLGDGTTTETPLPPFFDTPSSDDLTTIVDWMGATQWDLDQYGNVAGLVTEVWTDREGAQRPAKIDLLDTGRVVFQGKGSRLERVRYGSDQYDVGRGLGQVWIERQYVVPGLPFGLSPLMYAQWQLAGFINAQELGVQFFGSGAAPSGILSNTLKETTPAELIAAKAKAREAMAAHDFLVLGKGWEYTLADVPGTSDSFLKQQAASDLEVCRYIDIPADLVDVAVSGGHLTYANITERNLQFLIMSLNPALIRRETALSRWMLPSNQVFAFDRLAMLEMDPQTRSKVITEQLRSKRITPTEARLMDKRAPYTEQQILEIERFWGVPGETQSVSFALSGIFPEGEIPAPEEVLP